MQHHSHITLFGRRNNTIYFPFVALLVSFVLVWGPWFGSYYCQKVPHFPYFLWKRNTFVNVESFFFWQKQTGNLHFGKIIVLLTTTIVLHHYLLSRHISLCKTAFTCQWDALQMLSVQGAWTNDWHVQFSHIYMHKRIIAIRLDFQLHLGLQCSFFFFLLFVCSILGSKLLSLMWHVSVTNVNVWICKMSRSHSVFSPNPEKTTCLFLTILTLLRRSLLLSPCCCALRLMTGLSRTTYNRWQLAEQTRHSVTHSRIQCFSVSWYHTNKRAVTSL